MYTNVTAPPLSYHYQAISLGKERLGKVKNASQLDKKVKAIVSQC
jgi:hypothetical protein